MYVLCFFANGLFICMRPKIWQFFFRRLYLSQKWIFDTFFLRPRFHCGMLKMCLSSNRQQNRVTKLKWFWSFTMDDSKIHNKKNLALCTGDPCLMQISLLQISLLRFFKTLQIFGLCIFGANFISLLRFFGYFWPKIAVMK